MAPSMNSWKRICGKIKSPAKVVSNAGTPLVHPVQAPVSKANMKRIYKAIFTRENMLALLLCLILIALVIFTADTSPTWIYQGF